MNDFLATLPQFSHWRSNTLMCFASMTRSLRVNEGAEVVTPEERGSNFIIIRSGSFEVSQIMQRERRVALPMSKASRLYQHSATEDHVVIQTLHKGAVYGDNVILERQEDLKEPVQEKLVAVTKGELLMMDAATFRRCALKWGYRMQSAPTVAPETVLHKALCEKRWHKFREKFFTGILDARDHEAKSPVGVPVVPSSRRPCRRTARFKSFASRIARQGRDAGAGKMASTVVNTWEAYEPYPRKCASVEPACAQLPGLVPQVRSQSEPAQHRGTSPWLSLATLTSGIHGMHPGWCSSVVEKWLSGNALALGHFDVNHSFNMAESQKEGTNEV